MGDRVWQVPQDQFIAVWNSAESLDEAAARLKELAGGNVPRWAAMARVMELRKDGVALKELARSSAARLVVRDQ
jgi:hypothetical protein